MTPSEHFLAEWPAARLFGYAQHVPDEAIDLIRNVVIPRAPTINDPLGTAEVLFDLRAHPWVKAQDQQGKQAICRTAGHALRVTADKVTMLRGNNLPLQRIVRSKDGTDKARVTATVPSVPGLVGHVWAVRDGKALIALARPIPVRHGAIKGLRIGQKMPHSGLWEALRAKGAEGLQGEGLPLAPLVTSSRDWPRGQVLFDCVARRFVLRSNAALHHPVPLALICARFEIAPATLILEVDSSHGGGNTVV